jgi:hypothetical protein
MSRTIQRLSDDANTSRSNASTDSNSTTGPSPAYSAAAEAIQRAVNNNGTCHRTIERPLTECVRGCAEELALFYDSRTHQSGGAGPMRALTLVLLLACWRGSATDTPPVAAGSSARCPEHQVRSSGLPASTRYGREPALNRSGRKQHVLLRRYSIA